MVYWFVWKKDGVCPWPNWEPLLLVFNDMNELATCTVRSRFVWKTYEIAELDSPNVIEIIFQDKHHHPMIKTRSNKERFDRLKTMMTEIPMTTREIQKEEVPVFARDSRKLSEYFPETMRSKCAPIVSLPHMIMTPTVDEKIKELSSGHS